MKFEQKLLLQNYHLFQGLDAPELEKITRNLRYMTVSAKEYIFHQDDEANMVYFIISGKVSIEVVSAAGKVTAFANLSKNEMFGEFAVLDGRPRSASVKALKNTQLAYLDKATFLNMLETQPLACMELMKNLIARLRYTNLQVESLNAQTLKKRLLRMILNLSGEDLKPTIMITQEQLAVRVSASREKVNIHLKMFEKQGLIILGRGKINVCDIGALKQRCLIEQC